MKSVLSTSLIILFFLFAYQKGFSQAPSPFESYSSFAYKRGKNAAVHMERIQDSSQAFVFLFHFNAYYDLVFLDKNLQFERAVKSKTLPSELWEKPVQGVIHKENTLYVFMAAGSYMNIYETQLFKVNEEDGKYKSLPLPLNPIYQEEMEAGRSKLVKTFTFENTFYKIWHSTVKDKLYIFYYELGEVNQMYFQSLDLPMEEINKQTFLKSASTPLLMRYRGTSYDYHPSLFYQYTDKYDIYMLEDKILVSLVNKKKRRTELIAINTQKWKIEPTPYATPIRIRTTFASDDSSFQEVSDQEWKSTVQEAHKYARQK